MFMSDASCCGGGCLERALGGFWGGVTFGGRTYLTRLPALKAAESPYTLHKTQFVELPDIVEGGVTYRCVSVIATQHASGIGMKGFPPCKVWAQLAYAPVGWKSCQAGRVKPRGALALVRVAAISASKFLEPTGHETIYETTLEGCWLVNDAAGAPMRWDNRNKLCGWWSNGEFDIMPYVPPRKTCVGPDHFVLYERRLPDGSPGGDDRITYWTLNQATPTVVTWENQESSQQDNDWKAVYFSSHQFPYGLFGQVFYREDWPSEDGGGLKELWRRHRVGRCNPPSIVMDASELESRGPQSAQRSGNAGMAPYTIYRDQEGAGVSAAEAGAYWSDWDSVLTRNEQLNGMDVQASFLYPPYYHGRPDGSYEGEGEESRYGYIGCGVFSCRSGSDIGRIDMTPEAYAQFEGNFSDDNLGAAMSGMNQGRNTGNQAAIDPETNPFNINGVFTRVFPVQGLWLLGEAGHTLTMSYSSDGLGGIEINAIDFQFSLASGSTFVGEPGGDIRFARAEIAVRPTSSIDLTQAREAILVVSGVPYGIDAGGGVTEITNDWFVGNNGSPVRPLPSPRPYGRWWDANGKPHDTGWYCLDPTLDDAHD